MPSFRGLQLCILRSKSRVAQLYKESAYQSRRHQRHGFNPWVRKILWRRKWQPTAVFSPGKSHGQRNLMGYSPWDCKELDPTEHTHVLVSASSSAPCLRPFRQTPHRAKQCVINYWMEEAEKSSVLGGLPGDRASILNESQEKAHLGQLFVPLPRELIWTRIEYLFPTKPLHILLSLQVDWGMWSNYILHQTVFYCGFQHSDQPDYSLGLALILKSLKKTFKLHTTEISRILSQQTNSCLLLFNC